MKLKLAGLFIFVVAAGLSALASDVPPSLIVTRNGLEWAYASPCAPYEPNSCNATGQDLTMHDGWNVADAADFSASFSGFDDLDNAFEPGQLCASSYFDSGWSHCDYSDITAGYVFNNPWNAALANIDTDETFVVRAAVPSVPEPSSMLLIGCGFLALVRRTRKR